MKTEYEVTIGLEIHAELKTATKMFCGCKNDPLEKTPNINICPICLAHPGTLPTLNKKAIEAVISVGYALGSEIPKHSHFDRKSYFYPDLPKGYQISQYKEPLVESGTLVGVKITRVHLEEDTARLTHTKDCTYVDYNRAGLPLMELVTEPVIHSTDKAIEFAKELQLILRYLGASDADMDKGQMRIEPNVSLRETADSRGTNAEERGNVPKTGLENKPVLGTKVELKNINSFKAVKNAITYEIKRQEKILESGEKVIQETRGWNDTKSETFSQRVKEGADDYRYMPEPDLPSIQFVDGRASFTFMGDLNSSIQGGLASSLQGGSPMDPTANEGIDLKKIKQSISELPSQKRKRFIKEFGISEDQVEVLIGDRYLAGYFEEAVSELGTLVDGKAKKSAFKLLTNYMTSDFLGIIKDRGVTFEDNKITPENFAELISLISKGDVLSRTAKDILSEMLETGADPETIIREKDLGQISNEGEVAETVGIVIKENKKAVEDYKGGKETAIKFLVGQVMAKLRGLGNPSLIEKLLKDSLE